MNENKGIYMAGKQLVAPVLHTYVRWVLAQAQERGIRTLYFLARDGYILQKIAQMLCERERLAVSCRYLYCSRVSLRSASYHLIGKEASDLIFCGGCQVTVQSFLERARIERSAWKGILQEAGIQTDICSQLGSRQIQECRKQLEQSRTFWKCLYESSKKAYEAAIGYLRQEGLDGHAQAAIVDSGWTGSMQRSLRQLLEASGWTGRLTGFYFGLFQKSGDLRDGEYVTWYFSPDSGRRNKVLFNNNLLECFLSAPHGMTTGYDRYQDQYVPVLKKDRNGTARQMVRYQCQGILDGVKHQLDSGVRFSKKECERILHRVMAAPAYSIAKLYGSFSFCDDMTEGYLLPLADEAQADMLGKNLLPCRLLQKMRGRRCIQLFWVYGSVALVKNPVKRRLYWLNEYLCQWCRMLFR